MGIQSAYGGISNVNAGSLVHTTGSNAVGIFGNLNMSDSAVHTEGASATGLQGSASSGVDTTMTVQRSSVVTDGQSAVGADFYGISTARQALTMDQSSITTHGYSAHGLQVQGGAASSGDPIVAGVQLKDSSIEVFGDNASGARVLGTGASVALQDSDIAVHGTGAGIALETGGTVTVDGGSIVAQNNGVTFRGTAASQTNTLAVQNSRLANTDGIALTVTGKGAANMTFTNSRIDSGAGGLLDASGGSQTMFALNDHSQATGDVAVAGDTQVDMALDNGSQWQGAGNGINNLSLTQGSTWHMTGDSSVNNLSLSASTVQFEHTPGGDFKTLTVDGDLTGNGNFAMNTDLSTQQGDLLRVNGQTSGSHTLLIADSGVEPSAGGQQLMVVNGHGGDGAFALQGEHVDVGAFRYDLKKSADNWYLVNSAVVDPTLPVDPGTPTEPGNPGSPGNPPVIDPNPGNLSNGANAAVAAQSAAASLWNAQMNALVKRLGDLRMGKDDGGVWARGIGKSYKVDGGSSRGYDQNVTGLEIGADKAIPVQGGKVYLGAMVGSAHSDLDFGAGSSGDVDSKMGGVYATWIDDSGLYLDSVLKYSHFDNDIKSVTNVGEAVKGSDSTHGLGMDVEVGKRYNLEKGWFVEPQLELTAIKSQGSKYTTSNGLKVKSDDIDSLQSRVGALFGRNIHLDNGMQAQPYLKASYVTEHAGASDVNVNGYKLKADLPGNRAEVGFGTILQVSEHSKISLDAEYSKGHDIEEPYGINVGYRYLW
ncbi:autotransporter outer membrane beta-barrel domain-containing protein [Pseudomonas vancouverensis]|nr:autotransporter outer membrane beta-barrel domain-containing protein [Pseudomonas vancouverensis]